MGRQMTALGAKGRAEDTTISGSLPSTKRFETLRWVCSWSRLRLYNRKVDAKPRARHDQKAMIRPQLQILPFTLKSPTSTIKPAGSAKPIHPSTVAATASALSTLFQMGSERGKHKDGERATYDKTGPLKFMLFRRFGHWCAVHVADC